MMINYCGHFNENFLKSCSKRKQFFDKKMKLLNSDTSNKVNMLTYLNQNLDIENKEMWINLLNRMIRLTPRERELVKIN